MQEKEYLFYCYNCPTSGYFTINGYKYFYGEDFRTAERYAEYVDCGFNMVQARGENSYCGEEWEGSNCQRVFKEALKGGCEKILVTDGRFDHWIRDERNLIGEGRLFASEEELDKHVAELMAPYKDHPAFYGVLFRDEPKWTMFKAMGQLWKSIKRVCPQAFIQCNLLPIVVLSMTNSWFPEGGDLFDRFKRYLSMFVDETGADYIMYDNYPFYHDDEEFGRTFYRFYFKALQMAGQVCKEKGVKLYFVMQSFSMIQGGKVHCKTPNEAEMFYQANALMGFAAKQLSYYTALLSLCQ